MFAQSQEKDNNWINGYLSWIREVVTSRKTLSILMLGLLVSSGNALTLSGRQEERSNREEGGIVPSDDISNGVLNRVDIAGTPIELPTPFGSQQAADAIDLPYLEKMSKSEEFKSYLAELGIGAENDAEEDSDEQTENEVEQLEPRTSTGIINYQPEGDPVLVATGGTDVDIACSNSADTCLVTWYGGGNIHTQPFDTNDLTKPLRNETAFGGLESKFRVTDLSNGKYGLIYTKSIFLSPDEIWVKIFIPEGIQILDKYSAIIEDQCFKGPSVASYTYGFLIESCYYERQARPVENDGTIGEKITINTGYYRKGALSSRGNIITDVFDSESNTLIGKFVHMDTKIVSSGYTVPLNPQIAIGEYQSVAFGNVNEFLVATDGIEGTESKIYVLSGDTNSTFFNNCNYRGPYVMPNINMGPVETTYIGQDSEGRSLFDVTFRDISSNAVGSRCWYDKDLKQPQCSPLETVTSIPNVRKTSTAVTQDGELVREFQTSADEIWLQKYTCSPVPCAKTPDDVPSHPSAWSNSKQGLSKLSSDTESGNNKIGVIVGALLAILSFFVIVGSASYFWWRRKSNKRSKAFQLNELKVINRKSLRNSENIEVVSGTIDPSSLGEFKEIGKGGSGTVYKVKYHGSDAAVKKLPILGANAKELEQFTQEAELMGQLLHPNIVQFYGYYQDQIYYSIVMEYVSGGELSEVLYDAQTPFPWHPTRWDIAHDIASAVSYLHNNPVIRIIHRDLKSQNVLVHYEYEGNCPRMRAKVADVGISKVMSEKEDMPTMTKAIGTPFWMAPEVVEAQGKGKKFTYDEKVDTYSYGIILSELINRKPPFSEIENHFDVIPLVLKGGRPVVNREQAPASFVTLMERCWAHRANDRPEMKDVVNKLDQMEQEVKSFTC
jgi:tRNA A-37 threonylcarbamoyl transferase component Bud32